jgi:WD40 repeat protein
VHILNEHQGEVIFLKWNPLQKLLATGGQNDNVVDVWDLTELAALSEKGAFSPKQPSSSLKPLLQLQHSLPKGQTD